MATKGHSYEISNKREVNSFIFSYLFKARERDLERAAEWLGSNHFGRYVTGPQFTYPLTPAHVLKSKDKEETSPHILGKIANGQEIRRFCEFLFESKGPDLDHVLDWMADLKESGHRDYDKIPRMTVEVVVRKTKEWTEALGRRAKGGRTSLADHVLSIDSELDWFELTDASALRLEGSVMSHCVGADTYVTRVATGKTRIFSLRHETGKSVLTLELDTSGEKESLVQVQKRANGGLPIALCDAVVALLNHLGADDGHYRGPRYGLVYDEGNWSTVYDKWKKVDCVGRTALSDGTNTLFMCVTDQSKPLILARNSSDGVERAGSARSASDIPPHYTDQLEAAEIVNLLRADSDRWLGTDAWWLGGDRDSGTVVPACDLYERREVSGLTLYVRPAWRNTPETLFLPHGNDPARLIMEACEVRGVMRAKVCADQRISQSQIQRCLAFLEYLDVHYIGISDDPNQEPETKQFRHAFEPVRVGKTWKAFALDRTISEALKSDGKWETADYLTRYRSPRGAFFELTLSDQQIDSSYSNGVLEQDLKEIVSEMNRRKLRRNSCIRVQGGYGSDYSALLAMHNGRWTAAHGPGQVARLADKVLSNERTRPGPAFIGALLDYVSEVTETKAKKGRKHEGLLRVKNELLPLWFNTTKTFDDTLVHRKSVYWSIDRYAYCLTDRLCDLADAGYTPSTPKQIAQLRKALKRLLQSYGRGRILFPLSDEFAEVAIRWYKYLPKASLNRISEFLVSFKGWESTRDAAAEYLTILDDPLLSGTKLRRAIIDQIERFIGATDYTSLTEAQIETHARLFDRAILRNRGVYQSQLEVLNKLLNAIKPENDGLADIYSRLLQAKEKQDRVLNKLMDAIKPERDGLTDVYPRLLADM